jgi:hypothetical protein
MLLHFIHLPGGSKGIPLFVEIPVHDACAPYLITSNKKGLLWIERSFNGVVRSAMRETDWKSSIDGVGLDVIRAIRQRGIEQSWGNTFPLTSDGFTGARDYLKSYGFEDVELLVHNTYELANEVVYPSIPAGCAVLVPRDRAYLGILGVLGTNNELWTVVVHNPARGMAVLGDW